MKKFFVFFVLIHCSFVAAQKVQFQTLLQDKISIRALQIWDGKVWYSGTDSKFGYVSLKDTAEKVQMRITAEKLEFRTLAQTKDAFYTINVGAPAKWFTIQKSNLKVDLNMIDTTKTVFYDAFAFDQVKNRGIAISDPNVDGSSKNLIFTYKSRKNPKTEFPKYFPGEAHFAASNSNIAMHGNWVWIATGGMKSRIFKFNWSHPFTWKVYETPFVQGTASTGIYSIDFYDKNFGIAVGGDYTKQSENINNIATTHDGGKTWQIQASGKNSGYKTCVKFRPKSKGKDIIAVGDQDIQLSTDFGKTWTTISDEKGLFVAEWIDEINVVLAGKNRIVKMKLQ